ncbi:MAG: hypothetical protein ACOX7J_02990 [Bacillota bacterium]|jgi:hypothetical protein
MSYANFIPTIWAEAIERELERICVFAENCNRQYDGNVKGKGDSVRILGVGKPTVTTTTDKDITLTDAEKVEDTSVTMQINHVSYFNYQVGDIDKHESVGGVMEALNKEASEGVAAEMDKHIADLAADKQAVKDAAAAYQVTTANILEKIDAAIQKLYENNVSPATKLTITCSPRFYFLLKQAYVNIDTDNSKMLENGKVGRYGNVEVKMSNQVCKASSGAVDLIQLKTDRAIAFCNPMTHTEAYRPEKKFSDAVKGFVLYEGKIVRPKEMVVMNVKYTA